MYKGFKRLLFSVMILVIVVSAGAVSIEAEEIMDKQKNEEIVQVRFAYINLIQNRFKIADEGKSSFSTILWSRNVDEVKLYGYLQQYKDGTWKTIKTWSNEASGNIYY